MFAGRSQTAVPGPYNYSLSGIVQNTYYGDVLDYNHMPPHTPTGLCTFSKALGLVVYLGALSLRFWKNRAGDIGWDLTVVSLITLLIAPFTWRHYYVLEISPLMFIWFLLKAGRFAHQGWVLGAVSFCTLIAGTRYPDYLQTHLTAGPVRVFLVVLLPLSAFVLTATLLLVYKPESRCQA